MAASASAAPGSGKGAEHLHPDRVWAFAASWNDILQRKNGKFLGSFPSVKAYVDEHGPEAQEVRNLSIMGHALRLVGFQCVSSDGMHVWRASKGYLRSLLKGPTAHQLPVAVRDCIEAEVNKPTSYQDMGHGDAVDHCVTIALNHGYDIMYCGQKVTFDEKLYNTPRPGAEGKLHNGLIYGPSLALERTIQKTGTKNANFPDPYNTIVVRGTSNSNDKCACGKPLGGPHVDLIHECAILNCKHQTCNTIQCALEHFDSAHCSSL